MAVEVANLVFKAETSGLKKATQDITNLDSAAKTAQPSVDNLSKKISNIKPSANDASIGLRNARQTAGMLGYQIQDIAVQLQMGTNAFRVLGQQGSQIASAFGPTGAVYGAIIAVGAALVSALIPSLMNSKDAIKQMDEASEKLNDVLDKKLGGTINVLSDNFVELAKYQREAAEIQLFSAQIAASEALEAALKNINDQSESIQQSWFSYLFKSGGGLDDVIKNTGLTGDQVRQLRIEIEGLESGGVSAVEKLRDSVIDLIENQNQLTEEGRKSLVEIGNAANAYITASNTANDLKGTLDDLTASTAAFNAEEERQSQLIKNNEIAQREATRAVEERIRAQERINAQAGAIVESLKSEEQQIRDSYSRQRELILQSTEITGYAKAGVLNRLNEEELKAIDEFNAKKAEKEQQANEVWLRGVVQNARSGANQRRLIEQEYIDSRAQQTMQLLAFEDLLLKNKSESSKAVATIGINLLNQEKRENARKIISDSYTAAMSAYKSLAGIPFIGPALGAAAAATVIGAGVSYAAKSLAGRALGGQVRAGESYVVGERGPEILTMGSNGKITPNESIKGQPQIINKTANVSFQIVANDTLGFDKLLHSRRGAIISIINDALNDQGRQAIV